MSRCSECGTLNRSLSTYNELNALGFLRKCVIIPNGMLMLHLHNLAEVLFTLILQKSSSREGNDKWEGTLVQRSHSCEHLYSEQWNERSKIYEVKITSSNIPV